ncbi:uncharacterized protein LOC111582480 [Amphiprion ocellaris]|uniref:uncharacterized protein LOC111582480 n=1 Tax=Amphiprion ocellaris TaxID=80972 RepID=UPI002411092F|nr:uncharacterized protein LOC111582480 [Amphiprion ocellaris]
MVGPGGGVLLLVVLTGLVFSEEPAVTKLDGETVTLHLNQTEPRFKDYLWTYGRHNPVLAITIVTQGKVTPVNGTRFGNRLQTNIETASITISNLTVNDSGIFLAQILTETGTLLQRFNLTVQDNSVIFEKVLEGNSATLDPGIETLQKDHTVRWTKGPDFDGTLIAQWKDSNFYQIRFLSMKPSRIKYLVMVYELVPKPQISSAPANFTQTDGICSVSCSARNAPEVFLSWYQGEKKIIEISDSDISVNLTLPLQIQSQPEVIYTCRAANPVSDATVMLNSTDWCPPHHSDHQSMFWILVATVVVVAVVAFLILIICLYKRSNRQGAQGCCEVVKWHKETLPLDDDVSEESNERLLANPTQQSGQSQ